MEIPIKKIILMFTALLLLPFFAERAIACSCENGVTVCDAYQGSSAIFIGTVLSDSVVQAQMEVTTLGKGKQIETYSEKLYVFAVGQSFKGVEGTSVEVQTGMGGGDCGYAFKKGERYLVYAYLNTKTKKLHASICSRTTSISKANEDLDFLRGLPDSATQSRISGRIIQIRNESGTLNDYKYQGMRGVRVVIKGEKTFESFTNDDGVYQFVGIPPGIYKLKADLPSTLSNKEYEIDLPVAECARRDIYAQTDGRISGKVTDNQGRIVEGAKIKLMPAEITQKDSSTSSISHTHFEYTDKEGRFEFKEVTPGKYYLGVNLDQEPRGKTPYAKTFYPGTPDQDKATVIVLAEGEKLTGYDLILPPALPVTTIEGIFLWSDGRPVNPGDISCTDLEVKGGRFYGGGEVDAQGRFRFESLTGKECWIHGSTYSTVGGTMQFIDIQTIKILVTD